MADCQRGGCRAMVADHEYRAGDAFNAYGLSWPQAMTEAQQWIDRKNLRNEDIRRAPVKLEELFAGLGGEERWRLMVYQAADRILAKRGATTNIGDFDQIHRRRPPRAL